MAWPLLFDAAILPYIFHCASETRKAHVKCKYNRLISGWIMGQNIKHSETRACRYTSVNWAVISLGNGLSPVFYQTIAWANVELLSICPVGATWWNLNQSTKLFFKILHLEMSSARCRPFCLCPNVLERSVSFSLGAIQIRNCQCMVIKLSF